ncbi:hypothetical protein LCGC14_2021890, partial [marine sediment metagenome]
ALDEALAETRRAGLTELGLPYEQEPSIPRHLAAFWRRFEELLRRESGRARVYPDFVLFNGGALTPPAIRRRLLEQMGAWFADLAGDGWTPEELHNPHPELAVARGAAYYGLVRQGMGVRVGSGSPRTYYVGVGTRDAGDSQTAVCLVPRGVEEGFTAQLDDLDFEARTNQPVAFQILASSTRTGDELGQVVELSPGDATELPPIRTVLRKRKKSQTDVVSVNLHARLTEIGTLDLWCSEIDGRRSWRLQFDVRSAVQTDIAAHQSAAESQGYVDEATWQQCATLIEQTFGPEGHDKPARLVKRLAAAIGAGRNNWPASLLRRIWESLMLLEAGRRKSESHETRWLNLVGFSLRPGYGLAVDDWRVAQTWNTVQGKLVHPGAGCRAEGWILWRRIGGGLSAGQQQAVAEPLLGPVRGLHRQLTTGKRRGGDFTFSSHETAEVWRLLGSLELLSVGTKIELGRILLDLLPKKKMEPVRPAIAWAIGRIGARVPVYGPLNTVVPVEVVADWIGKLMQHFSDDPTGRLAAMQMARRTDDRYRELPEKLRRRVLDWFATQESPPHFIELVRGGGRLDTEEQGLVFGEALPKGLRMTC